jgi:hypothetical protein
LSSAARNSPARRAGFQEGLWKGFASCFLFSLWFWPRPWRRPAARIRLNPATADAHDYHDGQVPFIATGYYVNPSHTVKPQSATWVACQQDGPITTEVSVTQGGVAQCAIGAAGTYSINAWDTDKIEPCAINTCGILSCAIVATAQLTCP